MFSSGALLFSLYMCHLGFLYWVPESDVILSLIVSIKCHKIMLEIVDFSFNSFTHPFSKYSTRLEYKDDFRKGRDALFYKATEVS